jgi:hypothetical protein
MPRYIASTFMEKVDPPFDAAANARVAQIPHIAAVIAPLRNRRRKESCPETAPTNKNTRGAIAILTLCSKAVGVCSHRLNVNGCIGSPLDPATTVCDVEGSQTRLFQMSVETIAVAPTRAISMNCTIRIRVIGRLTIAYVTKSDGENRLSDESGVRIASMTLYMALEVVACS